MECIACVLETEQETETRDKNKKQKQETEARDRNKRQTQETETTNRNKRQKKRRTQEEGKRRE